MAKPTTVAAFLGAAIDISGKTQKQIAQEVGYRKPNLLSMMKNGDTKIPIDKIPLIARACGVDEKHFLRIALEEYMPENWKVIRDTLAADLVSDQEMELVRAFREVRDTMTPQAYEHLELNGPALIKKVAEEAAGISGDSE